MRFILRRELSLNILIVRVSSLGDVVHNMPMVADIHRRYPDASIDWVVEEAYTDLVRLNAGVRRVIPVALRRWRKSFLSAQTRAEIKAFRETLKREAYDVVFDTQGLFKTGLLMRMAHLAHGGKRVGMANSTEGSGYEGISRVFHTVSVPIERRLHAVMRARVVAAKALGYQPEGPAVFGMQAPALMPAWLPTEPYAVFFHGTARASKQWPAENWIRLAESMSPQGMPILLPWGSDAERQAAEHLASRMHNAHVLPKLPLMEAVVLAQRARLAVGVDTGLTHIAAAFERSTVELYCDSPRWKTEGNWSPNIINLGDEGRPPTVEQTQAAVAALLNA
jgi:heptosyltransferase-1